MAHKILIVDDNPSVLKLLNISLTKVGYEVIEAENGEVAFDLANKEKPELIISDIMMPQMDGLELCWMIRENSQVPLVPFIFLTSFDDQETEIKGFRAGADDYLNKPIDRKQLIERVHDLVQRTSKLKDIAGSSKHKGFSGDLRDLSIVELVQMLNMNKKTGPLQIDGRIQGTIYLKEGELHAAETVNKEGEQAFYELVTCGKGSFNFEPIEVNIDRNVNGSTMNVIMEACRIMDERKANE
jgi:DNA-binding response OmpR family regulator